MPHCPPSSAPYYPSGECRNSTGDLGTDRLFTSQILDGTGLYFYNARYYDPTIGRFISADTFVQYDAGFDAISKPLTVNLIPNGLGSKRAPSSNYPSIISSATVNPQALNRYSYCFNNPLRYTDPYGWWTFGIGLQGIFGLGGGGTGSISIVMDGDFNFAVVKNAGGGGYAGAGGSGGIQLQWTSASDVNALEGLSLVVGGSTEIPNVGAAKAGVNLGGEYILGFGNEIYHGFNFNIGVGAGLGPLELHGMIEKSWVDEIGESDNQGTGGGGSSDNWDHSGPGAGASSQEQAAWVDWMMSQL